MEMFPSNYMGLFGIKRIPKPKEEPKKEEKKEDTKADTKVEAKVEDLSTPSGEVNLYPSANILAEMNKAQVVELPPRIEVIIRDDITEKPFGFES